MVHYFRTPEDFDLMIQSLMDNTPEPEERPGELEVTLVLDDQNVWHGMVRLKIDPPPQYGPHITFMALGDFIELKTGQKPTQEKIDKLRDMLIEEKAFSREM